MSTLYTMVSEVGKKDVIVLNRNYTDEQLREKLSVPGDGYDEDWINYIIENGIRIPEGKRTLMCEKTGRYYIGSYCQMIFACFHVLVHKK